MEPLAFYISHPGQLNRETLYELRMLVGKYPYFDVARLLMLKNLYLLHDIEFGKELRKAALYLKNRWALFEIIEGYGVLPAEENVTTDISIDRTMTLIDAFLDTLPHETLSLDAEGAAAIDYMSAYMKNEENTNVSPIPELRGQMLIDRFLSSDNEKITLQLHADNESDEVLASQEDDDLPETSFFTETLANIYIKQKKYDKALEIIKRLCLEYPNKNRYFADQIRFLEKIVKFSKK
ncbi:MAG: tetratricopeptide repeat protein [Bacteroidaceae bacterium]|nr:tetratricopeptide repeat protein [Bacteroidaceae bacterium]